MGGGAPFLPKEGQLPLSFDKLQALGCKIFQFFQKSWKFRFW